MLKRSRAILFLAALGMIALTLRLGFWQLDRAAQKVEREQSIRERQEWPPLTLDQLPSSPAKAEQQVWRKVVITGRWDPRHTIYLDNRPMKGRTGFIVVTPLRLSDGSAVLVQRGWLPRDNDDRTRLQEPPTPETEQRVMGRMAPPPGRLYEFEATDIGRIRQNVDIERFAAETGLRLRSLSIQMLEATASGSVSQDDGLLRDWPQPAADVHKHYGYAFQWFALAGLTFSLYVWFQIIQPRRARRAAASSC